MVPCMVRRWQASPGRRPACIAEWFKDGKKHRDIGPARYFPLMFCEHGVERDMEYDGCTLSGVLVSGAVFHVIGHVQPAVNQGQNISRSRVMMWPMAACRLPKGPLNTILDTSSLVSLTCVQPSGPIVI